MRLVQINVELNKIPDIQEFYRKVVIPTLHAVKGCIYASLIQSHDHPGECVSMTLWDTQEKADEYGRSAVYRDLIGTIKSYFVDSTEWKIQLSKDLTLEVVPILEEPVVKTYSIKEFNDASSSSPNRPQLYVRIVVLKIHPGKMEEFKRIFSEDVLPALHMVKGCRYAFLTEGGKDNDEILSVTIWDSQQAASEYEASSLVHQFMNKLTDTFSEYYHWKMDLEKDLGKKIISSEDVKVKHYHVVTGESFRGF
jgi:quinol monooxygenase YgiN